MSIASDASYTFNATVQGIIFSILFLFNRFVISLSHLKKYNEDTEAIVVYQTLCISKAHSRFSVIPSLFIIQVITNACATQAILSLLMNVDCPDVNLGKTLTEFKEFSADFDPTMKGLAMSNSEELRATHNSFARQSVFEFDAKFAKEDDDVFHFGKT